MNPLSSLGAGSGGVLNYDIIDKLKKADENAQITPIDKKLQTNIEKQSELAGLKTMLSSLKGNADKLADYSSYINRNVSSSNENILKASAGAGVPTQNINIKVDSIAKNSVNEIGTKFSSRDSIFSNNNTTIKFSINGREFKINILNTDTLEEVAQKIIDNTDGLVNASIMKTGDGDNAYSLMINSKETGENNNIYFGNTLVSNAINDDNLLLNEGDLTIKLVDENGKYKLINIDMKDGGNGVKGIIDAIIKALNQDTDFANLIKNGFININLSADGKRIIINDKRGFGIELDGNKVNDLFTNKVAKEDDTVVGNMAIPSGLIDGTITIGDKNLNLSSITSNSNDASKNANAIVNAINNINGYKASINEEGKLIINSTNGEVSIKASKENNEALIKLGLNAGTYSDWYVLQNKVGIKNIQQASDAHITYNGIHVTRPSNTISDVVNGVTLDLFNKSDEEVNINISMNNNSVLEEIKLFVENYNNLVQKLDELTKYDEDTKIAGIFNNISDIKYIKSSLNRILSTTRWIDNTNESIVKYGLSFNDSGLLVLDESKLQNALSSDIQKVIDLFRGTKKTTNGKEIEVKGIFALVNTELETLTTGDKAKLKLLEDNFVSDDKRLKEERKKNMEMLDKKYETMAARFAAYDSQIAKANNSFNSLNMLIEQSINEKKK